MERKEPMTDKDLKELYLNNLHDLKNISNFLNLTEEQREKLNNHFQKIQEIIINSLDNEQNKKMALPAILF